MQIQINGIVKEKPDGLTVQDLLESEEVERPEMVSVELNDHILFRIEFRERKLQEGDRVEFIYLMGGGADRTAGDLGSAVALRRRPESKEWHDAEEASF
ncbi:MAG: sulfur carrier protein ThiS [Kiritimatiellaeota bacterium]|nr:sulfur carrier protein ThiS [Kiritimatiellota bacterium]